MTEMHLSHLVLKTEAEHQHLKRVTPACLESWNSLGRGNATLVSGGGTPRPGRGRSSRGGLKWSSAGLPRAR